MKSDSATDPVHHTPLHPLEFQILLCLAEGPAHAYAVVCAIEKRQPSGKRILPTNMYRRIWRLESKGLVEEVSGGKLDQAHRRKHLAITPLGRRVAVAEASRLQNLLAEAATVGVKPGSGAC